MNFQNIPWLHNDFGFYGAVAIMLLIPIWMLWMFRRKGGSNIVIGSFGQFVIE